MLSTSVAVRDFSASRLDLRRLKYNAISLDLHSRAIKGVCEMSLCVPYHTLIAKLSGAEGRYEMSSTAEGTRSGASHGPWLSSIPAGCHVTGWYEGSGTSECLAVFIDLATLPEGDDFPSAAVGGSPMYRFEDAWVWHAVALLKAECEGYGLGGRLLVESVGLALAKHLHDLHACGGQNAVDPAAANQLAKGGLAPWQARRVVEYLMQHLAEDVSLEDLAAITGLSRFHLCRAFKQTTGLPPHRWQIARRVERAQQMLSDRDFGIAEIALAVGFANQTHLSRAFRQATGMSPRRWRDR